MTSWGEPLRPPPQRRPRPAEHKGFGAERRGQRRRLSRSVPNFPRRGGSSDGTIAGRRSNLRAGRRVFPARPPPPRAHRSRVHVVRRRFENSSEPECGWTDRPARRQVGEPRPIASRRAGRGLQAVARPAAASGCATARGNGSRATNRGVPVPSSSLSVPNFHPLWRRQPWQEVPEVQPAGLGVELFPLSIVSFAVRLTGRACRCRPGAAALAGYGSVRRRERPGPASLDCSRLAPLLAGPRRAAAARAAPATTSAPPRSAPRACAHQCQRLLMRKTNTFRSSAGAPARLVGRAPSSTIRTHLAPAAQPPVALAGAVTLSFPASFGRVQVESASCPRERELSRARRGTLSRPSGEVQASVA